jgi:hypothetical protein
MIPTEQVHIVIATFDDGGAIVLRAFRSAEDAHAYARSGDARADVDAYFRRTDTPNSDGHSIFVAENITVQEAS